VTHVTTVLARDGVEQSVRAIALEENTVQYYVVTKLQHKHQGCRETVRTIERNARQRAGRDYLLVQSAVYLSGPCAVHHQHCAGSSCAFEYACTSQGITKGQQQCKDITAGDRRKCDRYSQSMTDTLDRAQWKMNRTIHMPLERLGCFATYSALATRARHRPRRHIKPEPQLGLRERSITKIPQSKWFVVGTCRPSLGRTYGVLLRAFCNSLAPFVVL